uniref:Uncharacterized protein n=1 Tax=Cannabis sativa TaxID=3483 RepID=A0A803PHW8_CANSA
MGERPDIQKKSSLNSVLLGSLTIILRSFVWVSRIREDCLIPKDHVDRAFSFSGGVEVQMVSDLKLESGGGWNIPYISDHFDSSEEKSILSILTPTVDKEDRLFWNFSTFGRYTVKKGYWSTVS